jgi:DNA-binding CsgD family transcriptional regulator
MQPATTAAARRVARAAALERYGHLSERERAVLLLVAEGYSAAEIGRRFSISPKTVETYKQRVSEKLGVSHRADFVQLCLRLGLLQATMEDT